MKTPTKRERISGLALEAKFSFAGATHRGYVTNLSEGGAFLHTEKPLPVGEKLPLAFELPWQLGSLEAEVEVRWRTIDAGVRAQHLPQGVGVSFLQIEPEARNRLDIYIEKFHELLDRLGLTSS